MTPLVFVLLGFAFVVGMKFGERKRARSAPSIYEDQNRFLAEHQYEAFNVQKMTGAHWLTCPLSEVPDVLELMDEGQR